MLDVHPPHEAAHSWKDFFIHIATICIGLLIAIGLEQSVEAIHRHHERRELQENLRQEAENNHALLDGGRRTFYTASDWNSAVVGILRNAKPEETGLTVTLPPMGRTASTGSPSRAVWTVAKASGTVGLLPEAEAEVFEHLDYMGAQELQSFAEYQKAQSGEDAVEVRLGIEVKPGKTIHLRVQDRDGLLASLSFLSVAELSEANWEAACEGGDEAVLSRVSSRDAMTPYIRRYIRVL